MTDAVESPSQEFLRNPLNLTVLDAPTREKFIDILNVVDMIVDHAFMELTPPEPPIHNELVGLFRNQEPSGLPEKGEVSLRQSRMPEKGEVSLRELHRLYPLLFKEMPE